MCVLIRYFVFALYRQPHYQDQDFVGGTTFDRKNLVLIYKLYYHPNSSLIHITVRHQTERISDIQSQCRHNPSPNHHSLSGRRNNLLQSISTSNKSPTEKDKDPSTHHRPRAHNRRNRIIKRPPILRNNIIHIHRPRHRTRRNEHMPTIRIREKHALTGQMSRDGETADGIIGEAAPSVRVGVGEVVAVVGEAHVELDVCFGGAGAEAGVVAEGEVCAGGLGHCGYGEVFVAFCEGGGGGGEGDCDSAGEEEGEDSRCSKGEGRSMHGDF